VPTPEFIRALRAKVGHDLLPLVGVCAVVLDDDGRLLMAQRRDSAEWAMIGGIVEPGEAPARCVVREVFEEAGVRAEIERLVSITADPPFRYPNGDNVQFLTLTFLLRWLSGTAQVSDDENVAVGWFAPEDRPALREVEEAWLARALAEAAPPFYEV
jgi:8-oxo-dGTP pyrophosphatase MutT (NUDIX family)